MTTPTMAQRLLNIWRAFLLLLLMMLGESKDIHVLNSTIWPLYPHKPLLLAWNAPTEDCKPRHGVDFKLDQFQIVASPNEGFTRQNLTIFYKDRLGLYPYIDSGGHLVNGGLPQKASLTQHREKLPDAVDYYIRDPAAKGLAVIDWEEWRPLWIRNWQTKNVYRNQSRAMVLQKKPTMSGTSVNKVAQQEFEMSARLFMLETLRLVKSLRPGQLWGFYLFPDCYNHDYQNSLENYTGRCPDVEVARNDQLRWLWAESTALFPSAYMGSKLRSSPLARLFVRNRVREALRLAQGGEGEGPARPVFVYARPTYATDLELLTQSDLVSTIGESVALGTAGIILWGDATYAGSKDSCVSLSEYLSGPLGRYLLNVSTAAEQCSQALCGWHGRCLRRNPDTDTYLHLSPLTHSIQEQRGRLRVLRVGGEHDAGEERRRWDEDFRCQCYSGYQGEGCAVQDPQQQRGGAVPAVWEQGVQRLVLLLVPVMMMVPLLH
ncbi:hyaluronidase-2 isoform X2 [Clupea harengus]|nr:hyaluronidase-2 isoform X2 [Clupea harengus]